MTDQEIRIAIAGECGIPAGQITAWLEQVKATQDMQCAVPGGMESYQAKVLGVPDMAPPDYPNDLNAMHEAVMSLPSNQRDIVNLKLIELTRGNFDFSEVYDIDEAINATARQRAEAFLRVKGKWKD